MPTQWPRTRRRRLTTNCSARRCLYSSGTTGQPKGIIRPLPEQPPAQGLPLFGFLSNLWQYRDDMIYLSPAPLYHSAPQAAVNLAIRSGGTVIVMERFDPLEYLKLIEQYNVTHTQLVPTMFRPNAQTASRMSASSSIFPHLKSRFMPLRPAQVQVKEQMIEWWGPIIHEYYGATEGGSDLPHATARNGWRIRERSARSCWARCSSPTTT